SASFAMRKEDTASRYGELPSRITRSRAVSCHAASSAQTLKPFNVKPESKRATRANTKRAAFDENNQSASLTVGVQVKKRAVLRDVTNLCCENSYRSCLNAAKIQIKNSQKPRLAHSNAGLATGKKSSKIGTGISAGSSLVQKDEKASAVQHAQDVRVSESNEAKVSVLKRKCPGEQNVENAGDRTSECAVALVENRSSQESSAILCPQNVKSTPDDLGFTKKEFIDIDSEHKNPQMCSIYAPEIYTHLRAAEVSEEYKLVPDTLYLTVYIIDRFLSVNYIERQRLQLLGITSMLIASKYEEICAPRVEEFCFITDNTYNKGDVLTMESQVLNCLNFQLSVPTIKTFLRYIL
ncbi:hypothetical protein Taro_018103, partial [Colocasia esculenta]|nr:hypothetical protein [Colocasia esculenta]